MSPSWPSSISLGTLCAIVMAVACATAPPVAEAPAKERTNETAPATSSTVPSTMSPPSVTASATGQALAPAPEQSCGDGCAAFRSAEAAFDHVLARAPRVLAVGEAHAQKGSEHVPSATRRFTESLLPRVQDLASDLVIEVVVAAGHCGRVEQRVSEKQRPVTKNQAPSAQNEFVTLAQRAKSLGIRPRPLLPTCEEYEAIARSGSDDIHRMLELITRITTREVSALLADQGRDAGRPSSSRKLVLTYGGALHNDVSPRSGAESWSFGPELTRRAEGAYIELDLIVPEYVKDTEVWRALPWYPSFASAPQSSFARVFHTGPNSYVLVFPSSV